MTENAITPAGPAATEVAITLAEIDRALAGAVVLTSSTAGRDIDLVCRTPERADLGRLLAGCGYAPRPRRFGGRRYTQQWARFAGTGTDAVDLNPAERWGVAPDVLDRLFDEARPLGGCRNVRTASPHHGLILLARRFGRGSGPLTAKQRSKVDAAAGADPRAWELAFAIAPGWHCEAALAGLRLRAASSEPGRALRLRAAAEPVIKGRNRAKRFAIAARSAPLPRRPVVVAISGIDGSGKSTQVHALRNALAELGVPTRLGWRPVGHGSAVRLVRRSAKRVLGQRSASHEHSSGDAPALTWDPNPVSRRLRERSPVLTSAWAAYVAFGTASAYRIAELRCRLSRTALVCDRHALDTAAHLTYQYGQRRRPSLAIRLSDLITPRADVAFHVDVPPAVARARKDLQYTPGELERLVELYDRERTAREVVRLDGTLASEVLAERIARDVWDAADG